MAYSAYITKIRNLHKHPNADRLQVGDCFGNPVCVSMEYTDNQIGVYFPTDGQLSVEFCDQNNLVRKKDADGNNIGGYMDPNTRNVTTIKLRGEKSDGLFLPLSCLAYTGVDLNTLKVGDMITVVNGYDICQKYIPVRKNSKGRVIGATQQKKVKTPTAPQFAEHVDTLQLPYYLNDIRDGELVEISLKMHGTSQRTGHLPVLKGYTHKNPVFKGILAHCGNAKSKIVKKLYNAAMAHAEPVYEYGYVTGTRRTVLQGTVDGYYGENEFRLNHAHKLDGKLYQGETVYYEVVGYVDQNRTIMGVVDNTKTRDKAFIKQYGKKTTFHYGCDVGQSEMYVYRMTMTSPDGNVTEYTPEYMRYRCDQMGVNCVPVFWRGIVHADEERDMSAGEVLLELAEKFYDGADPVGKTHVREGVVCRLVDRNKFTAYKHKNFNFKVIEGIAKVDADAPDMEEAQETE